MKYLILGISLLFSSFVFAADDARINITGQGTVTDEPDQGYITVGCATIAATSAKALADNNVTMQELFGTLTKLGVEKKDIKTNDFRIEENYKEEYAGNSVKRFRDGFRVSNNVQVTVCDLKSFGKILDAVVQDGANQVHNIAFGSSKADEKLDEARKIAANDAIRKAELIASSLGVKLGNVQQVSESTYRPQPAMYRSVADRAPGGEVPVSGGSLSFTTNITVTWQLLSNDDQGRNLKKAFIDPPNVDEPHIAPRPQRK